MQFSNTKLFSNTLQFRKWLMKAFCIFSVSIFLIPSAYAATFNVCELVFIIHINDGVVYAAFEPNSSYETPDPIKEIYPNSVYQLILYNDNEGSKKKYKIGMPVAFVAPHIGPIDKALVSVKVYCGQGKRVSIEKNGISIFDEDIGTLFCNENDICEKDRNETSVSCSDCKRSGDDGYCDRIKDGILDRDCFPGSDPDENKEEGKEDV